MFAPTGKLSDIVPEARPAFEALLQQATDLGMSPVIRGAGRTCAMQNALAAQGTRVTGASLCRSMHVLGRALDLNLHPGTCATYTKLGQIWESMGGTWGGRWTEQFGPCGDAGHFHWYPKPGGGSYGTPPPEVCPSTLQNVAECEEIRAQYLAAEFARGMPQTSRLGSVIGGLLLVAGVVLVASSLRD